MLFTRRGDDGNSSLFGTKERWSKDSPIYGALGTLDELNSLLGVCRAEAVNIAPTEINVAGELIRAQECLFIAQAELAGADKSLGPEQVAELESVVNQIEKLVGNPQAFIISGATLLAALLDYARAVSRRAERAVIAAKDHRAVSPATRAYLNRLSSLLYALARYAARAGGVAESSPKY